MPLFSIGRGSQQAAFTKETQLPCTDTNTVLCVHLSFYTDEMLFLTLIPLTAPEVEIWGALWAWVWCFQRNDPPLCCGNRVGRRRGS